MAGSDKCCLHSRWVTGPCVDMFAHESQSVHDHNY